MARRVNGVTQLETEGHVVIDGHMWIKRITLEYHRYVTIFWSDVIYNAVTDENFAFADFF